MGAVVVFVAATALLGFGQITGQEWVQAALGIYGIYGVSNAASKFGEAKKTRAGVEVSPSNQ